MKSLCKMVGVTYGEFLSWYNYGEIRICSSRVVDLETTPDGTPDPESPHVSTLLEQIPQLNLEDEEGILLIQLKPVDIENDNYEISPIDFHTIYLPIESIHRVIPLTERAGRILEPRMGSFRVKISPSYFDKQAREKWFRFGLRKAKRGGNTLVGALFENGLQIIDEIIDETLRKAVEFGVWELYYPDYSREDVSDKNITLIAEAFKYSRRKPFNNGDLDYILDAGWVLNKAFKAEDEEKSPRLGPFRKVSEKAIDKKASLIEVFKDTEWIQDINKMERDLLGKTSVGLTSLVLFLLWKERFHKMNQEVDFKKLYKETAEFAGSTSFENTVSAVWMFGCYVGHENVTPVAYAAPEMSSFSSVTEPRFTEKISKPENTITPDPSFPKDAPKAVEDSAEDIKESVSNEDAPPKTDTVEVTKDAPKAVEDSAEDIKESVSNEDAPPKTDTVEVSEDAPKAVEDSTKEVKKGSKPEPTPDPELVVEATKPKEHKPVDVGKIAQSVKTAEMQTVDENIEPVEVIAKEQKEAQIAEGQVKKKKPGSQNKSPKKIKNYSENMKKLKKIYTKPKNNPKTDLKNQGVQTPSEPKNPDETEGGDTDETSVTGQMKLF